MASKPPPPPKPSTALGHLRVSDLRAMTQLATQATQGVANMAEGVHQAVLDRLGARSGANGQTSGITGLVYRAVHGVTELVGKGLEAAFTQFEPALESLVDAPPETPEREAVLAALNGVMGDRLAESNNPLATPMTLRYQGLTLNLDQHLPPSQFPEATGKVLLLLHGLCMNDLQWRSSSAGDGPDPAKGTAARSDHGVALADQLGYTPIYLRYNTGLHTSQNAHELATLLEQLLDHWPVPVQELTVVGHSMGGLVIRGAIYYARLGAMRWPEQVKNIVFLGTPHHGAPLERAGNWIDVALAQTPYSKPFAKLGQLRSAGITDLRWGNVLDADWQGQDRFQRSPDSRQPMHLPQGIACFTVAATAAAQHSPMADNVIGDGLVPLPSALGQHKDPQRCLIFPADAQIVAYNTNHVELLNSPEVTRKLLEWLTPAVDSATATGPTKP